MQIQARKESFCSWNRHEVCACVSCIICKKVSTLCIFKLCLCDSNLKSWPSYTDAEFSSVWCNFKLQFLLFIFIKLSLKCYHLHYMDRSIGHITPRGDAWHSWHSWPASLVSDTISSYVEIKSSVYECPTVALTILTRQKLKKNTHLRAKYKHTKEVNNQKTNTIKRVIKMKPVNQATAQ